MLFRSDAGVLTRELQVSVAAVNDAPTIDAPSTLACVEDVSVAVGSLVVADVDAAESFSGLVEASLAVGNGTLTLGSTTGLHVLEGGLEGQGATLRFRGAVSAVNGALDGLEYLGAAEWSGDDAIVLNVSDLGNVGDGGVLTATATIAVRVAALNDAPTIELPQIGRASCRERV